MTTPLSDYFSSYDQPLLGGDPFLNMNTVLDEAWDADLHPHEYGDQSGHVHTTSWDEHSFTDSECCEDENDEGSCCDEEADEPWNLVYTTSITVVATATNTAPRSSLVEDGEEKCPEIPSPLRLERRDSSKVRFCEQPPQEHNYEHCSREEHAQLYYSVHELQKFLEELRLETSKKQQQQQQQQPPVCAATAANKTGSGIVMVSRSV